MSDSTDRSHPRPVAIITGAGSGIGKAAALMLAKLDHDVALVARSADKLQLVAKACQEAGQNVSTLTLAKDITDPAAPKAIVEAVMEKWGRLDVLLNIAGSAPLMPIERITPEAWRLCVDSNLTGAMLLTAAAWPVFKKQKAGFVGNVSSMASVDPFPGFAMYAAAKTGLNMFTLCTAREGVRINVRAVAVAPGAVETPMLRANFNEKLIPRDKTLTPEDVAMVLCDCLMEEREFTPGETIVLPSP